VFRAEIEAYVAERGLAPRVDASNDSLDHTRNRIRHQVMPLLREFNPKVERALAQLADLAQVDNGYFFRPLSDLRNRDVIVSEFKPFRYKIHRNEFAALHRAIQARALNELFGSFGKADLTYRHITRSIVAIHRAKVGKRLQLPHGVTLRVDYQYAYLERDESAGDGRGTPRPYTLLSAPGSLLVPIPSSTFSRDWQVRITAEIVDEAEADRARPVPTGDDVGTGHAPSADHTVTLALPITAAVTLRGRRDGDRFAPKGMDGHTQKIKQWMIDRKIPAAVRDHVPLLDVDGQIAAILWGDTWAVAEPLRADRALREGEQYVRFTVEM
jgi:tRNA(Ile)-lysidine synthase